MNKLLRAACAFGSIAFLWSPTGCVAPRKSVTAGEPGLNAQSRRNLADEVVSGWTDTARLAAQLMMKRYGSPDEVGSSRLVWNGNGPWKRTIVRQLPAKELGVLEQTMAYRLTPAQASVLTEMDGRLSCDVARMELSSRSDREEVNFLRLNLANDVINGRLTAQEARESYARILSLEQAGKASKYMSSLSYGARP